MGIPLFIIFLAAAYLVDPWWLMGCVAVIIITLVIDAEW